MNKKLYYLIGLVAFIAVASAGLSLISIVESRSPVVVTPDPALQQTQQAYLQEAGDQLAVNSTAAANLVAAAATNEARLQATSAAVSADQQKLYAQATQMAASLQELQKLQEQANQPTATPVVIESGAPGSTVTVVTPTTQQGEKEANLTVGILDGDDGVIRKFRNWFESTYQNQLVLVEFTSCDEVKDANPVGILFADNNIGSLKTDGQTCVADLSSLDAWSNTLFIGHDNNVGGERSNWEAAGAADVVRKNDFTAIEKIINDHFGLNQ